MATTEQATVMMGGKSVEVQELSPAELEIFEREWPILVEMLTAQSRDPMGRNIIRAVFDTEAVKQKYLYLTMLAKAEIDRAGVFGGLQPRVNGGGFGWQPIRPDYVVPSAQGRTFLTSLSGLTANSWYGLYHNGAIGAAYNATPLYMRDKYQVAIEAIWDVQETALFDSLQFELEGVAQAVISCRPQVMSDLPIVRLPFTQVLRAGKRYRSAFRVMAASGTFEPLPLGVAWVSADRMETQEPEQNSTTAP